MAQLHLLQALEVAASFDERDAQATAWQLLGRTYLRMGDDDAADGSYTTAIELLRQLELPDRLRECATEYADLLHRQGRLEESIAHWRIAAGATAIASPEERATATGSGA
jgi:tetratricopeptide (TPR) repeat protein